MRILMIAVTVVLGMAAGRAVAQTDILPVDEAFQMAVTRDAAGRLQFNWAIADGYYMYRDRMAARETGTGKSVQLDLPRGQAMEDQNFGSTEIYTQQATASASVDDASELRVRYQGCKDHSICYPPIEKIVDVQSLSIADAVFDPLAGSDSADTDPSAGFKLAGGTSTGLIPTLLVSGGPLWVVGSFLVFGLLLAFTPCVLPMYPILAATLARSGEQLTAGRGFALSAIYVVAMAAAYSLLGIAVAWSGQNLQIALQSTYAAGAMALVFVALAASMFGAFELALPARWLNRITSLQSGRRGSAGSAAALGFTSALIVGPCVTAPLAAALLYIGQSGDLRLGAAALFALGLGQGLPLIAFGTLGSRVLPRAGAWMVYVKYLFGLVFLGAATWLAAPILPPTALLAAWGIVLICAGVFIGAFDHLTSNASNRQRVMKTAGLLLTLYGGMLSLGAASGSSDPLHPLAGFSGGGRPPQAAEALSFDSAASVAELKEQLASASSSGKPALVYFTADWCVTCKVIDKNALAAPTVLTALGDYRRIKIDLTKPDGLNRALLHDLGVVGPPTMIFFDAASSEVPATRLVGDITAESLVASAQQGKR
ncbi:protein-disulfide reductase DsbD [Chelatococcus sp. GCM10030263]|uniref:protein-disulfide reductase DsbD n=1 Tax=Chelatococcus sp. GCM10030263 TaxID=3273387 RepID=UPI00361B36F5